MWYTTSSSWCLRTGIENVEWSRAEILNTSTHTSFRRGALTDLPVLVFDAMECSNSAIRPITTLFYERLGFIHYKIRKTHIYWRSRKHPWSFLYFIEWSASCALRNCPQLFTRVIRQEYLPGINCSWRNCWLPFDCHWFQLRGLVRVACKCCELYSWHSNKI